ncbi:hypothetical protein PLESTB_000029400 [Pleodorina starrii]|uniref:Uncharacterized protein n=1 Tax=Pleodorina starrii TaxID=330485 RepID=A0A9W6B8W7_9CHLO|nr:hypothetical protein PLESTB_000029400 [Pleodorina starrii]
MLGSQGGAANLAAMFAAAAQGAAAHAPGRIPRRPRQTAAAAAAATGAFVAPLGVGILPIPGLLAQQQQQQLLLQQQQQQQRPASMDVMIEVEKPALRQAAGRSLVITDSTAIIVRGWTPNVGYQDPEKLLVSLRLHIANSPDAILNAAKLNGFRPGEPSSVELRHPRRKRDAPMVVVTGEYLQQAITMAADNNEPIKLLWGSFPLPIPQPPLPQQQEPSEGTRATVSGGGGAKRGRTGRKSSDPLLVSTGKGMGMPSHMQQSAFQFPALDARQAAGSKGASASWDPFGGPQTAAIAAARGLPTTSSGLPLPRAPGLIGGGAYSTGGLPATAPSAAPAPVPLQHPQGPFGSALQLPTNPIISSGGSSTGGLFATAPGAPPTTLLRPQGPHSDPWQLPGIPGPSTAATGGGAGGGTGAGVGGGSGAWYAPTASGVPITAASVLSALQEGGADRWCQKDAQEVLAQKAAHYMNKQGCGWGLSWREAFEVDPVGAMELCTLPVEFTRYAGVHGLFRYRSLAISAAQYPDNEEIGPFPMEEWPDARSAKLYH